MKHKLDEELGKVFVLFYFLFWLDFVPVNLSLTPVVKLPHGPSNRRFSVPNRSKNVGVYPSASSQQVVNTRTKRTVVSFTLQTLIYDKDDWYKNLRCSILFSFLNNSWFRKKWQMIWIDQWYRYILGDRICSYVICILCRWWYQWCLQWYHKKYPLSNNTETMATHAGILVLLKEDRVDELCCPFLWQLDCLSLDNSHIYLSWFVFLNYKS